MKKQFGQQDYLGLEKENGQLQFTRKRGFGYFLWYCECGKKIYITKEELLKLLRTTNLPLPLREILTERIMRKVHIPKLSLVVEWRRLEDCRRIPLAREEKIAALRRSGMTLKEIGEKYHLTRQRVWQILKNVKVHNSPNLA